MKPSNLDKDKMDNNRINVTQPFLPPLDDFQPYLEQIWKNKWLTNNGPFHQQFEKELADYLNVPYVCPFANGTLALITALQALNITGEVITTPYTFVATAHALVWNKLIPVFVDVDPVYGNLDPDKIEAAITDKTSAILPVHVYGNSCETEQIQKIADKHKLKVIYDAAHAFGVKQDKKSILNSGDLSILSFHATKVFNTFEGGAIICHTPEMKHHIENLKNFGFRGETIIEEVGINAKMNELQAAMGLLQLKHVNEIIKNRKSIADYYYKNLTNVKGLRMLNPKGNVNWNYSYFPIFIDEEKYGKTRDELYLYLKEHNIFGRRYFYPLISNFSTYKELNSSSSENLKVANSIAEKVICLPIYPELEDKELFLIKRENKRFPLCHKPNTFILTYLSQFQK